MIIYSYFFLALLSLDKQKGFEGRKKNPENHENIIFKQKKISIISLKNDFFSFFFSN